MNAPPLSEDESTWIVLVNPQSEYSLWRASAAIPSGWREVGPEGTAEICAAWVDRQWKSMQSRTDLQL